MDKFKIKVINMAGYNKNRNNNSNEINEIIKKIDS